MEIKSNLPLNRKYDTASVARKETHGKDSQFIRDSVSLGNNDSVPEGKDCRKVFGSVGALVGALSMRAALPIAGAIAAGAAATLIGGPILPFIAGAGALAGGAFLEKKTKLGRFLGGIAGGAAGVGLGRIASLFGHKPSKKMVEETKGFTFKSLFNKLWDPDYTSHKLISSEKAQEMMKSIQPGDLIITSHDGSMTFEMSQKILGHSGDWTHVAITTPENTALEVLVSADGPVETPLEEVFTRNHHVMIIRPDYKNPESVGNTLKEAREYFGKAKYDFWFNMDSDDKLYCHEYIYKAMQKGAPEVPLKISNLFGREYLAADDFINSPGMKEIDNTGSSFWLNMLSKYH